MIRRAVFTTVALALGVALAPQAALASVPHAGAGNIQCAQVRAQMPHQAQLGDSMTIGSGLENCGTQTETFRFVERLDGPCGTAEHLSEFDTMRPGEGFASAEFFQPPCVGRYRLLVEAFLDKQLLDRKVRHMTVTG